MPENILAVQLWRYTKGQIYTHSVKGSGKDEYDTLVGLNLESIQCLFDWWRIRQSQRKHLFIKLFEICELVHNREGLDEFKKIKAGQSGFNNFLGQLFQKKN